MIDLPGLAIEIPALLQDRPRYGSLPIPYITYVDEAGVPRFPVDNMLLKLEVMERQLCALCGKTLYRWKTFATDQMGLDKKIVLEPAMHNECAVYAFSVCPYLMAASYTPRHRKVKDKRAVKVPWYDSPENGELCMFQTRAYEVVRVRDPMGDIRPAIRVSETKRIVWPER